KKLRKMTLPPAGKRAFALFVWIHLSDSGPERRQRRLLARVIPHARGHDTTGPRDARHLREPTNGIRHEVNDELRQRCVELFSGERELLGGRALDVDPRM